MTEFDAAVLLLLARHHRAEDLTQFEAKMSVFAREVGSCLLNRTRRSGVPPDVVSVAQAYKDLANEVWNRERSIGERAQRRPLCAVAVPA